MLVEIHMLQNHSPSNPNRDDLGAPKTCMFGGVLRARISSQCIKRSIRTSDLFKGPLKDHLGIRTVTFPKLVEEALAASSIPEEERKKIVEASAKIAKGEDDKAPSEAEAESDDEPRTAQLIFLGPDEAERFVAKLSELRASEKFKNDYQVFLRPPKDEKAKGDSEGTVKGKGKKKAPPKLKEFNAELRKAYVTRSADIGLFGRMTTSRAFENFEAAMQVGHAFSTNALRPEVDYFTAMDDRPNPEVTGAALVKENQFNSSTFYKYFSLDFDALADHLNDHDLAGRTLRAFIEAAVRTVPTGKKNSHAHNNLPDGILVEIKKKKLPTSYANAFLKPVEPADGRDVMVESIRALAHYIGGVERCYGPSYKKRWWATTRADVLAEPLPKGVNFETLISELLTELDPKPEHNQ